MLHWDRQSVAGSAVAGEGGVGALHQEIHLPAHEAQRLVRKEGTGQQSRLAEHLEAVADPEHRPAGLRVRRDRPHRGREAGDRPGAQVVAVGESARHHDHVDPVEVSLRVPDHPRVADAPAGRQRVAVIARARELNDAEPHFVTSIS